MALVITNPWTDSPISGIPPAKTLPLGAVNFGADFAVITNEPKEVQIGNMTTPLGANQRFRFSVSDVANVYSGTGVDPTYQVPSKRGTSVLCQLTSVLRVSDTENASYEAYIPLSTHIVVKVPLNGLITDQMVLDNIGRMLSGLFETGSDSPDRIRNLVRNSLLPADMR